MAGKRAADRVGCAPHARFGRPKLASTPNTGCWPGGGGLILTPPRANHTRGAMMLRLAALALLAITLGAIPGTWATEAITFPTMGPSCLAWCIGYPPQNNNYPQLFPARPSNGEEAAPDIWACDDHIVPDCATREGDRSRGDQQQADRYLDAAIPTDRYIESKAFDVSIQIRDSDISKGTSNCIYIE